MTTDDRSTVEKWKWLVHFTQPTPHDRASRTFAPWSLAILLHHSGSPEHAAMCIGVVERDRKRFGL